MDLWQEIEKFSNLILELGLPGQDLALFGVKCPYCGKSDRIHRLERPEELKDPPDAYRRYWELLGKNGDLVVCTFCRQVLSLDQGGRRVNSLEED